MQNKYGTRFLILASIFWSFAGVCIKVIDWNGYAVAGIRGLIAAVVLLGFIGRPHLPKSKWQIAAILSYTGLIVLMVVSTKLTTAANSILLQFTAPVYSAVLGYFLLQEPVRSRDVYSITLIFVGLIIFLYDGLSAGHIFGNILALLSGVCYGAMNVFMRMGDTAAPGENVFWGNILAFFLTLPFMEHPSWTPINIGIILFMGIFQLGVAYIFYAIAITQVTALSATIITVLEPILNPIWVMLIYGETPSPYTILGGILVLCAIGLRSIQKNS